MPALLQVMGLAAMAFLASALLGSDQRRAGAPGVYVLVGVLIGPFGLRLLDDESQRLLRPVLSLAITWLGWLCGMRLCDRHAPKVDLRLVASALLEAGAAIVAVTLGLHLLAPQVGASVSWAESAAVGIAVAASSHVAVEIFRGRLTESRPTFLFLEAVSSLDAIVPLVGLLVLSLVMPAPVLAPPLEAEPWRAAAAAVGLGLGAGLIFVLAVGRRATVDRGWVVLVGVAFLAAGVAGELGVSELVVGAVAGAVMARSAGGRLMAEPVASSERPIALLIAVLVGTRVGTEGAIVLLALLVAALRVAGKLAAGPVLGVLSRSGRNLGVGLLTYGGFALAIAAQIDLSYDSWLGSLTLTSAVALCLVGDTAGTFGLLTTLRSRGELVAAQPTVPTAEAPLV